MMRISSAVWLGWLKMPSDWFVTFVFGIPTVFKESGLQSTFGFSDLLEATLLTVDQIHHVGGDSVEMVLNGELLSTGMARESMTGRSMLNH